MDSIFGELQEGVLSGPSEAVGTNLTWCDDLHNYV